MPNDEAQAEGRQRRWRRRSVWAVGIVFALAVVLLGVPELLPQRWVGAWVARGLSAYLDEEVRVEKARVTLWGDFHLSDVTVGVPGQSGGHVPARVGPVRGRFSPWALLRGRVRVRDATVESAWVFLAWRQGDPPWVTKLLGSKGAQRFEFRRIAAESVKAVVVPPGGAEGADIRMESADLRSEADGSYRLEARLRALPLDKLVPSVSPEGGSARAKTGLPRLPPHVRGSFHVGIGRVTYGEQSFSEAKLAGSTADGVVTLTELSARTGEGTVWGEGRLALGGEGGHALTVTTERLLLERDFFEMLRRTPCLEVVNAALPFYDLLCVVTGGPPQRLQLKATVAGAFHAEGQAVAAILASLEGEAEATLTDVWFVSSPLLQQVGALLQTPVLREMQLFERIEAPFRVGDGRVALNAVMPYQQGALVLEGTTDLAEAMAYDYRVIVRNPKGIKGIPSLVGDYLAGGRPAALVRGRRGAPVLTLPWKAIRDYMLDHPARSPGEGQEGGDEPRPEPEAR
ncbi:MAG: AsmA-like C-terminal region-containing protein [Planctomycetota bacterium]